MGGRNGEPFGGQTAAVPHRPARRERQIIVEQMHETALEPSANIGRGNVMPALPHPQSNAGDGLRGTGEPEVMQLDLESQFSRTLEKPDVVLPLKVDSKANVSRRRRHSSTWVSNSRAARTAPALGLKGESPRAISSALRKRRHFTSLGRNSFANVVLPAPLHPAMT